MNAETNVGRLSVTGVSVALPFLLTLLLMLFPLLLFDGLLLLGVDFDDLPTTSSIRNASALAEQKMEFPSVGGTFEREASMISDASATV